ncbi:hypothetical protein [Nocardia transvalensis]|uniref:hypothetical protein n=1 Tax=Nocardia transvalensis TaxID=37333 RepID=UPI001895ED4E|nr:hypothetical protein [Nocardia transvalensis]MBF6326955.1 hypothetical protein [Nocardia transvalensis]
MCHRVRDGLGARVSGTGGLGAAEKIPGRLIDPIGALTTAAQRRRISAALPDSRRAPG